MSSAARQLRGKKGGTFVSRSKKAGLVFPVDRVHSYLKNGKYASYISAGASVYLSAVLEYVAAEALEIAGNSARDLRKHRITCGCIRLAICSDEDLQVLLGSSLTAVDGVQDSYVILPSKKFLKGRKLRAS